jgi:hypothetical protein
MKRTKAATLAEEEPSGDVLSRLGTFLAKRRWSKTTKAERAKHARKMALARWGTKKKAGGRKIS